MCIFFGTEVYGKYLLCQTNKKIVSIIVTLDMSVGIIFNKSHSIHYFYNVCILYMTSCVEQCPHFSVFFICINFAFWLS